MNPILRPLLATAVLFSFCHTSMASLPLAQSKACMACHAVDKAVVGPAFKDVAKRYAKDKGAEAKLVQKVLKGGGGVWGNNMMPANPQVNEADAKTLVKWILTIK